MDRTGDVRWNSNLRWSQATYLLLVENHVRDKAFGLAPAGARTERRRGRIPHEETGFSGRRRLAADFALFGRTCP
ncbi:hypothetical protein [Halorubrum sp. 2020YC2]|uniref:hypothetical protein n=1 Tax=Halorubrum sp. 2020YC2 TaxID=2836432 RepID=UPI001BEC243E|nr:hypothetical protein [Halorubrum sp. 2020YC2]QWC20012.1 hypothetical protein KI388_03355 [Halorubrum sp. 2020YC2]